MAAAAEPHTTTTTTTTDNVLPSLPQSSNPITIPHVINIGTRKSHLARVQTDIVVSQLQQKWPQHTYKVHAISTMGDKNQVTALHSFGDKGLWTHELEAMLLNGDVDFIVHSLKDMPTKLPPSCALGAILAREDPRDALIFSPRLTTQSPLPTLSTLPAGSVIGTSSVRRSAQLTRLYPHLAFQSVRGNIGTRLTKLDAPDSPFDAIILAAAGLIRVDLGHRISGFLESANAEGVVHARADPDPLAVGGPAPPAMVQAASEGAAHDAEAAQRALGDARWGMLHAVGQGALGIEVRADDARVAQLLEPIRDRPTTLACLAERSLMRRLEGGCSVPIGVETEWGAAGELTMRAIVVALDGRQAAEASVTRKTMESEDEAEAFGVEVALELIKRGADEILNAINAERPPLEAQEGAA